MLAQEDRAQAYGRVVKTLEDMGASKLLADEQATIREAADALLFATDMSTDEEARAALDRLDDLVEALTEADRITPELGEVLLHAVESCGPQRAAA